jgi:hypothetical protein
MADLKTARRKSFFRASKEVRKFRRFREEQNAQLLFLWYVQRFDEIYGYRGIGCAAFRQMLPIADEEISSDLCRNGAAMGKEDVTTAREKLATAGRIACAPHSGGFITFIIGSEQPPDSCPILPERFHGLIDELIQRNPEPLGPFFMKGVESSVMARPEARHISSASLADAVIAVEREETGHSSQERHSVQMQLARRLGNFGLGPKNCKVNGRVCKGYSRAELVDLIQVFTGAETVR